MHDKESLAQSIAGAGTLNNIPSLTAVLEAKGEGGQRVNMFQ